MKKIALVLITILTYTSLLAQENYSNGYIITNSNDTIYGKLDLRTSQINQQKCLFLSSQSEIQTFLPGEIKAYRYTDAGKFYITKEINLEGISETIFIEYLVQGGLNLFYFELDKQSYFLFDEEGREPLYIKYKEPEKKDNRLKYDNKFIGQLRYHFKDSSHELIKLIDKSSFNQKSMIAIAKQYNDENCLNPDQISCVIFENKRPDEYSFKLKFSAYTGLQNSTYSGMYYKGSSIYPLIGGQVYVYNPRWSKSIVAVGDISFSKIEKGSPIIMDEINKIAQICKYNMYTLSPKIGIRYTYSRYKFRPSIEGGIASVFVLKNNSTISFTNSYGGTSKREYDLRMFHLGGYLGAGIEYNIIKDQFIFARINFDMYAKSDNSQKKSSDHLNQWQIKVGYTF